jgi:hypothetical protein
VVLHPFVTVTRYLLSVIRYSLPAARYGLPVECSPLTISRAARFAGWVSLSREPCTRDPVAEEIILGGAKIASISLRNKAEELIRMNLS